MFGQDVDERRQDVSGNATHGGAYPPGGHGLEDEDLSPAAEHATRQAGADADPSLFTTILGALSQKRQSLKDEDIDEEDAVKQHKKHYEDTDDTETDGKSIGAAAAMQALKKFTSGGSEGSGSSQQANSQSAFIGMAMGEAAKLFDQKASAGKVQGSESKDSAVMEAAQMALKFYMKGKGGDQTSSGAGGLLSMAAKFM